MELELQTEKVFLYSTKPGRYPQSRDIVVTCAGMIDGDGNSEVQRAGRVCTGSIKHALRRSIHYPAYYTATCQKQIT